jgi:hypothetical protein
MVDAAREHARTNGRDTRNMGIPPAGVICSFWG